MIELFYIIKLYLTTQLSIFIYLNLLSHRTEVVKFLLANSLNKKPFIHKGSNTVTCITEKKEGESFVICQYKVMTL